jgi:hypothetical protein
MEATKVKAEELIDKFSEWASAHRTIKQTMAEGIRENAIQCAIIAVNEILNGGNIEKAGYVVCDNSYWQQVKEHLKTQI